jgi:pSer/pThr/pTyr-binding forkhead associated (FHA) protein/S1-C subfamily serine protease
MPTHILISHLAGSKTNQVEQFPVKSFPELSIGREPDSAILFDSPRDDAVSRKHAVIKVTAGDPPSFKLSDLNSSNGTFLNGERLTRETELLPCDIIQLGTSGPKFTFDLEPRPINLAARTRIVSAAGSPATRVIDAVEATPLPPALVPARPEAKPAVGRDTVMRLLSEQRQTTSRLGLYALAAVLAIIIVSGGAIYYKNQRDVAQEIERVNAEQLAKNKELASALQQQQQMLPTLVHQQIGTNAREISEKYSNATVLIDVQWRLYDRETGKPLFHKTFILNGDLYPAYVIMRNRLYRWLTTEDEEHSNFRVGSEGQGTGFLIDSQGLIITNKHIAAGWLIDYNSFSGYERGVDTGAGIFVEEKENVPPYSSDPKRKAAYDKFAYSHFKDFRDIKKDFQHEIVWYPQDDGGPIFANKQPIVIGNNDHTFEGRNELLEVRFPGKLMNINARLVRASTEADAALIKIDATETLAAVPLAMDSVKIGDHVVVLGYPSFSIQNTADFTTAEQGKLRRRHEDIPQPTVTEGIVSNISLAQQRGGGGIVSGSMGDAYQMTLPSGAGNSGGPVFDGSGKVVGLFTYASIRETTTFAVPIKYARDLLQMQRTSN